MSNPSEFPGLDYDFMRYIGVRSEVQRELQSHYLPYFENRRKVLDLACGDADFVALLYEKGIDVTGVDSEPKPVEQAQQQGLPVVEADVFEYLAQCEEYTYDGIFCAHLVEHLPYPQIIKLIEEAYRVLEPGGIIVLATPNARSLFSHLEMFYMHYDHVNFCHPKLLCFFMERANFVDAKEATNPFTASPLMAELQHMFNPQVADRPPGEILDDIRLYHQNPPVQNDQEMAILRWLRKVARMVKDAIAYVFIRPYLDKLSSSTYQATHKLLAHVALQAEQQKQMAHDLSQMRTALGTLNGPFECYALAYKPASNAHSQDN